MKAGDTNRITYSKVQDHKPGGGSCCDVKLTLLLALGGFCQHTADTEDRTKKEEKKPLPQSTGFLWI